MLTVYMKYISSVSGSGTPSESSVTVVWPNVPSQRSYHFPVAQAYPLWLMWPLISLSPVLILLSARTEGPVQLAVLPLLPIV